MTCCLYYHRLLLNLLQTRLVDCAFKENFGSFTKEIVIKQFASPQDEFRIKVLSLKQFVHVTAVATHFFGKPRHAVALPA